MKRKILYLLCSVLLLTACKSSYVMHQVDYIPARMDSTQNTDKTIAELIAPYTKVLDTKMNKFLVENAETLSKAQPESTLGNLLADATFAMAEKYSGKKPDLAIINYGGIRVPNLAKGKVTLGQVYEVMPFDNYLLLVKVDAQTLKEVFELMASKGGWPLSKASYTIYNSSAKNIRIQGKEIEAEKEYWIAISDYLANGGDNMKMLKGKEQLNTGKLLRDAFIEYFELVNQKGEALKAKIENRVVYE